MAELTVATPAGDARVTLEQATGARRLLVIGHGAGGSVQSSDLVAIRDACLAAGISVARVTQPYRLAGRRTPPAAPVLDGGWAAVLAALGRRKALAGLEFVYAGRSSGARVACRTAADPAVTPRPIAVVAVAFPVHPPGKPDKSRLSELAAVPQPVLVVQGRQRPVRHAGAGPGPDRPAAARRPLAQGVGGRGGPAGRRVAGRVTGSVISGRHARVGAMTDPLSDPESIRDFLAARDFLLSSRGDYRTAYEQFRWPRPERFNWALDYFDGVLAVERAEQDALRLIEDDGSEARYSFAELSASARPGWPVGWPVAG